MNHQDLFLAYLRHYAARQLAPIADMLAEDVTLRDWKIFVRGKAAALAETRANFEAASSIEIQPLRVYTTAGGVAGELRILIDGQVELHVVDTMDFDADGRIKAIRAYLGRGDEAPATAGSTATKV